MKLSEEKIKKLIRESLVVSEVVALSTGTTSFKTVDFQKCEKLDIPPVFRKVFFDKVFGQNPTEMASNFRRDLSRTPPAGMSAELWAQRLNATLSPEVFDGVLELINTFANAVGVPAVVCKFLQLAIDKFGEVMNLLYDEGATEDDRRDLTAPINRVFLNALEQASSEGYDQIRDDVRDALTRAQITREGTSQTDADYLLRLFTLVGSDVLIQIGAVNTGSDTLPSNDARILAALDNSFKSYTSFISGLAGIKRRTRYNTSFVEITNDLASITETELVENQPAISRASRSINDSFVRFVTVTNRNLVNSFEDSIQGKDQSAMMRERQGIVDAYRSLFRRIFGLFMRHVMIDIPNAAGQPDYRAFYRDNPTTLERLNAIAGQLRIIN